MRSGSYCSAAATLILFLALLFGFGPELDSYRASTRPPAVGHPA